ncbi:IS21 family transposase [Sorangium sp. So ce362]|uniref:IS21 family transposase n=1 Tax=Sorangium sp. So ce362 TaxID=3133303 RepID=UPI003F5EB7C6
MTIDRQTEAEIRRLYFSEHWKKGTIAEQLGLHHDVVDRVVGPHGPSPKDGGPRPSVLDAYQGFVLSTLDLHPTLVATRLYDMLVERGYTGSIRTLRRFVLLNRPAPRHEVYLRIETLAGEQSQIDWAHVGKLRVAGGVRPLYCFVLLLRYSRAIWAELVLEQTTASLVRSLVRAAEYFGGVTHEWLFDNPKSIVAAREGSALRFQTELIELASQLHVALRACRVRKPTDKGGVERAIRYLKTRFFPARTIPSIESGNAALLHFLETVAMQRRHPTQKDRTVGEVFAEEKARLLPLPGATIPTELVTSVPADKTAFVSFDGNRYSVLPEAADRTLRLVATDVEVRLLDEGRVVGQHARSWAKGQVIEASEHRAALLAIKAGARDGKRRDRLRAEVPQVEALMRLWLADGRNVGSLVARTTKLLDLYGARVLAVAVEDLLKKGSHDYGALAILCEQSRARPRPVLPIELGPHVVDRDVIPHDLGSYDDDRE